MQITLKRGWEDLTIGEYQQLLSIQKEDYEDLIDKGAEMVMAVYNVDANNIPYAQFQALLASLNFTGKPIPKGTVKGIYNINGTEYALHTDFANITTAQYIDYTNYSKEGDYVGMLSTVFIPKDKLYCDGYDINKVKSDIETLSMVDCKAILDFFLVASRTYIERIIRFSHRAITRGLKKVDKTKAKELEVMLKQLETLEISVLSRMY